MTFETECLYQAGDLIEFTRPGPQNAGKEICQGVITNCEFYFRFEIGFWLVEFWDSTKNELSSFGYKDYEQINIKESFRLIQRLEA